MVLVTDDALKELKKYLEMSYDACVAYRQHAQFGTIILLITHSFKSI